VRAFVEHVRKSSRLTVGFGEGEDGMQLDAVGRDPALAWGLSKKPTPLSVARQVNLCASCAPVRTATWRIQAVLAEMHG
jgi:hypothetical protein